ncbi:MAG: amino acid ABC transporter permease [Rhodospirillales bacterium]|nr:amino acid ABC transporter permease [Rhodospirillales bacterium]
METFPFITEVVIPALNDGLALSIELIVPSAMIGLLLGIIVGSLRTHAPRWLMKIADAYAALFRGTPLVLQLFFIYYGFPKFGISLDPYGAALVGFTLCSGAYHSEYIRGSLLATKQGQYRAADALGFSTFKTLVWIVVPQAVRRALPGCGNEIIYLIKYSSLAYVVTCMELTGHAREVAAQSFRFTETFFVVGLYYLAIVTVATFILRHLEKRLRIPGFGVG